MATNTAKYGLTHPADPDPADVTSVLTVLANQIDAVMAGWNAPDIFANRPAASAAQVGRFFYATDYGRLYMCVSPTLWIDMMPPVGTIYGHPSITPPDAFHLYCNGQAVGPRLTGAYVNLFSKIGTTFGVGNGTTTFNVPDYRGRVLAGADDGAGRMAVDPHAIGQSGGEERHTLLAGESGLPDHQHNPLAAGAFICVYNGINQSHIFQNTAGAQWGTDQGQTGGVVGGAQNAGSPHENMPPYQVAAYMIRI